MGGIPAYMVNDPQFDGLLQRLTAPAGAVDLTAELLRLHDLGQRTADKPHTDDGYFVKKECHAICGYSTF
jgi:hypothetical protein